MKKIPLILWCVSSLLLSSCAFNSIPKSLDPESQEFLSKARYLITGDERRVFLGLPESERPNFIEEFWKKRDPDPTTEVNEFKVEYFRRIDEANRLLKEGTTPGWLQDRGRLYILLGPPDNRETYPRGLGFYGVPTEIWYYGFFRVVFVDAYWTGDYRLDPDSPGQIAEIVRTQVMRLPKVSGEKGKEVLDARFEVKPVRPGEALLRLKIPYKNIWFNAEGNMLKSTLELKIELLDSAGKKAWDYNKSYSLAMAQNEFLKNGGGDYLIEVTIEAPPGTYTMSLNLKNTADGSQKQIRGQLTLQKSS
jgi:GWxTD domain-containing protein